MNFFLKVLFLCAAFSGCHGSMAFVILRHVRTVENHLLWQRCYSSIREFYSDTPIVIIDDNSYHTPNDEIIDENTTVIAAEFPGAGELLPYYYFLKEEWGDKMIFLHDSMFLIRPFKDIELSSPVTFHWCFVDHRNDDHKRINDFLSCLKQGQQLIRYNLVRPFLWHGCFGCATQVDLSALKKIEKQFNFTQRLIPLIKSRDDRMALERVLAILLFKAGLVNKRNCSNFGNILKYPYCFESISDEKLEELKSIYPGAILKTWHGR